MDTTNLISEYKMEVASISTENLQEIGEKMKLAKEEMECITKRIAKKNIIKILMKKSI